MQKALYLCFKQIVMRYQFVQPSPALALYVKHYWMLEINSSDGQVSERVVPTDSVQLMFHYKRPFVVTTPDRKTSRQPQSMVSGLSNSYICIDSLDSEINSVICF
ncbi:MAG: hypothetical protein RBS73_17930 [Prolixibacteraceae bacterium]|jgi:hypothetical protein|nr:hypothetical protein [Prolixibacteraceae bacterium]